jgi:DNA-binding NtrC family response regulator
LVNHFVDKAASVLGKPVPTVPLALYQLLKTYSFPGNVRELEGLIFDAVTCHEGAILSLQSFKEAIAGKSDLASTQQPEEPSTRLVAWSPDRLPTLKEAEDALIAEALSRADGNQGVAAGLLGVSRQALNKRLRRRSQPELSAEPPE